jgi:hypothetical protein
MTLANSYKLGASLPAKSDTLTVVSPSARKKTASCSFDDLPDGAFVRESQLVQSPKRPGAPAPLPFSAPTLSGAR